jgi:CHRD domain
MLKRSLEMRHGITRLAVLAGLTLCGAASADDNRHRNEGLQFKAALVGAQEVTPPAAPTTPSPGVETNTAGSVRIQFSKDLSEFRFVLFVQQGLLVTQAHLHCGRPGQNGPIFVFLAPLNTGGADVDGVLASGTRTNADLLAGAANCEAAIGRPIRNIASIALAARDGLIYANVHTVANPAGEVRGQLLED